MIQVGDVDAELERGRRDDDAVGALLEGLLGSRPLRERERRMREVDVHASLGETMAKLLDAPTAIDEDEPSRPHIQAIDEQRGVVERADEVEREFRRLSRAARVNDPLGSQAAAAEPCNNGFW